MFWQGLPLVCLLAGLVLYTVLAGADFGAGLWQLLGGRGETGTRVREHAHHSMSPVWEANHVWLIFVLVVFWTAYPPAFGAIASTLAVPLFIAALGIIFRGAAYAFRAGAAGPAETRRIDLAFSLASILTPFSLGTVIGAITTDRVPPGNAAGHLFSSWTGPTSIMLGVLAVTSCAYLAAVYLAADAAALGDQDMVRAFRRRALAAGVVAGAMALGGLLVLHGDAPHLLRQLFEFPAIVPVIGSFIAGTGTLALVAGGRFAAARYLAATAVAAIICGWALARWPTILPGLTVQRAAAGHSSLVAVTVALAGGALLLAPSLAALFRLTLSGRFRDEAVDADLGTADGREVPERATGGTARLPEVSVPRIGAATATMALAGFVLLNVADAGWAHALGVLCYLVAVVLGAYLVLSTTLPRISSAEVSRYRDD